MNDCDKISYLGILLGSSGLFYVLVIFPLLINDLCSSCMIPEWCNHLTIFIIFMFLIGVLLMCVGYGCKLGMRIREGDQNGKQATK